MTTTDIMIDASMRGDVKTVAKLIADQVSTNAVDEVGRSALHHAAAGTFV